VSYVARTASWNNDRNPKGRNKFLRAGVRLATLVICEFIDANREAARSESGNSKMLTWWESW
jgi:hypothetical protein